MCSNVSLASQQLSQEGWKAAMDATVCSQAAVTVPQQVLMVAACSCSAATCSEPNLDADRDSRL